MLLSSHLYPSTYVALTHHSNCPSLDMLLQMWAGNEVICVVVSRHVVKLLGVVKRVGLPVCFVYCIVVYVKMVN